MEAGLKNHADQVKKRGLDEVFTEKLTSVRNEVVAENDVQERLKAELKTQTVHLNAKLKELNDLMQEAKRMIKTDFPQETWKEFGITDKR